MKKIIIAGGSGFLGRRIRDSFDPEKCQVVVLTRNPQQPGEIKWDGRSIGDWASSLEGCDALINLAGRTVDCRYNEKNKKQILNSRIESTRVLGQAIEQCRNPPQVWLNSSTSTIYRDTRGELPANTEAQNNVGDDFSMNVARSWEEALFQPNLAGTTRTALRIAIVLGESGGAFPIMRKIARFGLCSPQGPGDQWISWLHVDDFCAAIHFLLEHPVAGPVNLCAPNPIQNRDFNQLLKQHVKPWLTLPQPVWLLEIGAFFMRTETELILKSRKVAPACLLRAGFEFKYPHAKDAIADLIEAS